ncbi:hypothetical protein B0H13DRAFT_2669061 [Mycena leptocephala]|nr:hypothetical protein B0H13DRAFT_2669061 [Mycena leptocephala]
MSLSLPAQTYVELEQVSHILGLSERLSGDDNDDGPASGLSFPETETKAKKAAAAAVLARERARLPTTLKRSVPSMRKSVVIVVPRPQLARLIACNVELPARFGASRTRSRPGPSPLFAVVFVAAPVSAEVPAIAIAFDPKQVAAAGSLVATRIRLASTAKEAVIGKAPFQNPASEIPARFGASCSRTRPGPSPLRAVFTALELGLVPPLAETVSQDLEEDSIAHALASLFASVYQDAEEMEDNEDPFKFNFGLAGPAPVELAVLAPVKPTVVASPVTIIVESPSLVLGDRRLDAPSSRSRQRSNSFKVSLATRRPAPSYMAYRHGGSKGKKDDSKLLQVPPLSYRGHSRMDKENENGNQRVPSRPHRARVSP